MNLVDTPGTNVILQRQQRLTEEFVPRADLVLFVLSADRPLTESEVNWSQPLWLRYFSFLYYFFYSCKSILHFIYGNLHELSIVRLNSLTNNQHFVLLYFSFFLLDKAMQAYYFPLITWLGWLYRWHFCGIYDNGARKSFSFWTSPTSYLPTRR